MLTLLITTLTPTNLSTLQAVGLILGVIAAKLAAETFDIELLSPLQSLLVVGGILGVSIGLSLAAPPAANTSDIDVLESK